MWNPSRDKGKPQEFVSKRREGTKNVKEQRKGVYSALKVSVNRKSVQSNINGEDIVKLISASYAFLIPAYTRINERTECESETSQNNFDKSF